MLCTVAAGSLRANPLKFRPERHGNDIEDKITLPKNVGTADFYPEQALH